MVRRVCRHLKGSLKMGTRMEKTAEALEGLRLLPLVWAKQVEWGKQSSSHPTSVWGMVGAGFQQMLRRRGSMKEGRVSQYKKLWGKAESQAELKRVRKECFTISGWRFNLSLATGVPWHSALWTPQCYTHYSLFKRKKKQSPHTS